MWGWAGDSFPTIGAVTRVCGRSGWSIIISKVLLSFVNAEATDRWLSVRITLLTPGVWGEVPDADKVFHPVRYTPRLLANTAKSWDGIPLVWRHPFQHFGARHPTVTPSILAAIGLGFADHCHLSRYTGNVEGWAWLSRGRLQRVAPQLLERLEQRLPVACSTSMHLDATKPRGQPWRPWGMEPNHIALLGPDDVPALPHCGIFMTARSVIGA
jgi:hypothetical protein